MVCRILLHPFSLWLKSYRLGWRLYVPEESLEFFSDAPSAGPRLRLSPGSSVVRAYPELCYVHQLRCMDVSLWKNRFGVFQKPHGVVYFHSEKFGRETRVVRRSIRISTKYSKAFTRLVIISGTEYDRVDSAQHLRGTANGLNSGDVSRVWLNLALYVVVQIPVSYKSVAVFCNRKEPTIDSMIRFVRSLCSWASSVTCLSVFTCVCVCIQTVPFLVCVYTSYAFRYSTLIVKIVGHAWLKSWYAFLQTQSRTDIKVFQSRWSPVLPIVPFVITLSDAKPPRAYHWILVYRKRFSLGRYQYLSDMLTVIFPDLP